MSEQELPIAGLGFVENLSSCIEYAENSTVSKTIVQAEGVHVVLFSFDEGQELSEHTASMPVIVQTLEGTLEVTADGKTVVLEPGGFVHFSTRLPHAVKALTRTKIVLYMLK